MTTSPRPEYRWRRATSESYSCGCPSPNVTATIIFRQPNIGKVSWWLSALRALTLPPLCPSPLQYAKFYTVLSLRTISAVLELFFPVHRAPATDTRRVAHRPVHHSSSFNIHPERERHQGDRRRLCECPAAHNNLNPPLTHRSIISPLAEKTPRG